MPKVIAFRDEDITPRLLLNQLSELDDIVKLLVVVEREDGCLTHYYSNFSAEEMVFALELTKAEIILHVIKGRRPADD